MQSLRVRWRWIRRDLLVLLAAPDLVGRAVASRMTCQSLTGRHRPLAAVLDLGSVCPRLRRHRNLSAGAHDCARTRSRSQPRRPSLQGRRRRTSSRLSRHPVAEGSRPLLHLSAKPLHHLRLSSLPLPHHPAQARTRTMSAMTLNPASARLCVPEQRGSTAHTRAPRATTLLALPPPLAVAASLRAMRTCQLWRTSRLSTLPSASRASRCPSSARRRRSRLRQTVNLRCLLASLSQRHLQLLRLADRSRYLREPSGVHHSLALALD